MLYFLIVSNILISMVKFILCLFIDITYDTNPYKNIINQVQLGKV